jgi:glycosyltransferase involved in cell wall biosynthesis
LKIIQVLPFFLPLNVGGTEVYVWSLCKYLQQHGIEAEVLVPNFGRNDFEEYVYDGIKVVKYPENTIPGRLHKMGLEFPEGIKYFKEYLCQSNPDWVHFHGLYGSVGITMKHITETKELGFRALYTMHLAGHICRAGTLVYKEKELCDGKISIRRCASCVMVHRHQPDWLANIMSVAGWTLQALGLEAGYWNSSIGTGLSMGSRIAGMRKDLENIAASCEKVIVLTDWFRKLMIVNGFPAAGLVLIRQALPYGKLTSLTGEPLQFNYPSSVKIIFAGRIDALKGLDLLLRTMQEFPEKQIELSIYGKAEDEDYHRLCLHLSEGKTNIHWRGVLPPDQMIGAFRNHDMLCLPSAFSEMSPLVIQEAFAAGIPVLASRVYGNMEQIEDGKNGLLFAFRSEKDLKRQILLLIQQPDLLETLKKNVNPPSSFDEVGRQYEDIYKSIA